MMTQQDQKLNNGEKLRNSEPSKTPDESGVVRVDSFVRIYDPESQEIMVEIRE
jgi:hypothetical protein